MLTPRTRLLATLSSLYTVRDREKAFRIVKRAVRTRKYPTRFFTETFIHLSLFLGYPAMLDGLERLAIISGSKRMNPNLAQKQSDVAKKGKHILRRIYGKQATKLISHLDGLEPGLGTRITEDAYGSIMGRPGLSLADRELINVVILFIDGFEPQLFSHLRGALRVGVEPHTLRSVLLLAARISNRNPRWATEMLIRIAQNPRRSSF